MALEVITLCLVYRLVVQRGLFLTKELIIYCDESNSVGRYYSNFYGGAVVESENLDGIIKTFNDKKIELNLYGEVKWSKITEPYHQKYICLLDTFFNYIERNEIKMRVMFTQNMYVPPQYSNYHKEHGYFILYYQFVKHAFGLKHFVSSCPSTRVRLYFDQLPDTREKISLFKTALCGLTLNKDMKVAGLQFNPENITDVKSHNHVILQCVDIVLGAMQFRLNDLHKTKSPGSARRGKRTIAKEKVYTHINKRIRKIHSNFNIGITTGSGGDYKNTWEHAYRHWLFVPNDHLKDLTKTKKAQKNNPTFTIPFGDILSGT